MSALTPPPDGKPGPRWPGRRRRPPLGFVRDARGATAVEFGLVALPFFAIIFAIIETALVFWSQQILDTALNDAVRQLYTGQFQQANSAVTNPATLLSNLKTALCTMPNGSKRPTIFTCSKVVLDVRTFASFQNQTPDPPIKSGALNPSFGQYMCPNPGQIVLVRAVVEYPVYVKLLNPNQANLADGNRLLMATAAFQTEPYTGQCS
jgi:pilus assembly protein Flp/PilA